MISIGRDFQLAQYELQSCCDGSADMQMHTDRILQRYAASCMHSFDLSVHEANTILCQYGHVFYVPEYIGRRSWPNAVKRTVIDNSI